MVKLVSFSCILVFVLLGSAESVDDPRVIGGIPVLSGQFPFLVSVQDHGSHWCGGSIISPNVILTAAHCLSDRNVKDISVFAGTPHLQSRDEGEEIIPASRIIWHDKFKPGDSDVGLVFLSSPLKYSATIKQIELPDPSEDFNESTDIATVAGWGAVSGRSSFMLTARYVNIPLWGRTKCLERVANLTENNICAGTFDGKKNACPGDSGGPLFIGNKVIGIVSWGFVCGVSPVMYASVTNLLPWINANRVVQNNS